MAKRNKLNNRKREYDGHLFDSVKELKRYGELKLLEQAGEIRSLELQKSFELIPTQYETYERYSDKTGKRLKDGRRVVEHGVKYIADFVYRDKNDKLHVEDVKGYRDGATYNMFVIKRKLMLYIHGVRIEEI